MQKFRLPLTLDTIERLFSQSDTDKDQCLSLPEFVYMVTSNATNLAYVSGLRRIQESEEERHRYVYRPSSLWKICIFIVYMLVRNICLEELGHPNLQSIEKRVHIQQLLDTEDFFKQQYLNIDLYKHIILKLDEKTANTLNYASSPKPQTRNLTSRLQMVESPKMSATKDTTPSQKDKALRPVRGFFNANLFELKKIIRCAKDKGKRNAQCLANQSVKVEKSINLQLSPLNQSRANPWPQQTSKFATTSKNFMTDRSPKKQMENSPLYSPHGKSANSIYKLPLTPSNRSLLHQLHNKHSSVNINLQHAALSAEYTKAKQILDNWVEGSQVSATKKLQGAQTKPQNYLFKNSTIYKLIQDITENGNCNL